MTVIQSVHVAQRTWRGYDDPGLPVGMWFAQGAVTGDASAGSVNLQLLFRDAGNRSGRFFNVEQIEAQHSVATNRVFAMTATNWEAVSEFGLVNRRWGAILQTDSVFVSLNTNRQFPCPIFLGITSVVTELPSLLTFSMTNVDLSSFIVTAQGYIWEPRSVLAEGGLRRPIDSLYGGGRQ